MALPGPLWAMGGHGQVHPGVGVGSHGWPCAVAAGVPLTSVGHRPLLSIPPLLGWQLALKEALLLAQDQARLSEDGCCLSCPPPQPQNSECARPRGGASCSPGGPGGPGVPARPEPPPGLLCPPRVRLRPVPRAPRPPPPGLYVPPARAPRLLPRQLWRQRLCVREPLPGPAGVPQPSGAQGMAMKGGGGRAGSAKGSGVG